MAQQRMGALYAGVDLVVSGRTLRRLRELLVQSYSSASHRLLSAPCMGHVSAFHAALTDRDYT